MVLAVFNGAAAETLRIATYNVRLERRGPGLLLRDIERNQDDQITAVRDVIAAVSPDVLLLQKFDYDYDLCALNAFAAILSGAGADYPYVFALPPNTGVATEFDLDGNGRKGEPRDAQGYGRFAGQGGMAILSRLPVNEAGVRDFSTFLWRELPGSIEPRMNGHPFPSPEAFNIQRLSSTGHWDVPLRLPDGGFLHLWAIYASPPVFDGAEDRNGRRNHDEAAFWLRYLEGELPESPEAAPFVLIGDFNLDPVDGDGRPAALRELLKHPEIQDARPKSVGGAAAAVRQGGSNIAQSGEPSLDTVDWPDAPGEPGNMRVDYVLPAASLDVVGSGVYWPVKEDVAEAVSQASHHRLVWVDVRF